MYFLNIFIYSYLVLLPYRLVRTITLGLPLIVVFQLVKLREKQETLRQEKHQLFCQLKKVLHEEGKRKARLREQRYLATFNMLH